MAWNPSVGYRTGSRWNFYCRYCGYLTKIYCGRDRGLRAATVTVVCRKCTNVLNEVISWEPCGASDIPIEEIRCSICSGPVEAWEVGSCPKCGEFMECTRFDRDD